MLPRQPTQILIKFRIGDIDTFRILDLGLSVGSQGSNSEGHGEFAKHDPQMNENDANLINAIDFINETKQPEEENQKPQPTEITIIEKRSLRTKVLLICGIVILSTALIGTFIYIGMQLYNLFA